MIYHHSSLSRGMPKEERQNIGTCESYSTVATSSGVSHGVACNMPVRHSRPMSVVSYLTGRVLIIEKGRSHNHVENIIT